jgi:hypothetical protein
MECIWNSVDKSGSLIFWLERFAMHLELRCKGWKSNILAGRLCDASGTPLKRLEVKYFGWKALRCIWNSVVKAGSRIF